MTGVTVPARRTLALALAAILLAPAGAALAAKGKKDGAQAAPKELVWPLPPDEPRIRYVRTLRTDHDFKKKKKSRLKRFLLGPQKETAVGLQKPYAVATDSEGRVYVTDSGLKAVMVFHEAEKEVRVLDHVGQVKFHTPLGIAVDGTDRIFVSDVGLHQIVCINTAGDLLMAFGSREGLVRPAGMAVDQERRRLYVSDTPRHLIVVYDLDGHFVQNIGERGSEPGKFNFPTNLAVDGKGRLHVVDTGNFRIQTFSADGEFLSTFGEPGNGFGQFTRPKGIAVDSDGHLYVVDAAFNNFQIFTDEGQLLLFVGAYGHEPGSFWLPAGVHIDSSDRVYVADQVNMRVQVFQYLPESTAPAKSPDPSVDGNGAGAVRSGLSR